jgi:hypothetical protein
VQGDGGIVSKLNRRTSVAAALTIIAAALMPVAVGVGPASASTFTPNVFGKVQTAEFADPANISSIVIYEVSATGSPSQLVRTPVAQSTGDDSVTTLDDTFSAYVDFRQGYTYEMDVVPSDSDAGGTTTFRLPGPAGDPTTLMAFRLEAPENPGLYEKVRQWACRADDDVNCVEGFQVRTTTGPGAWQSVDDTTYYPTYECDTNSDPTCYVQPNGTYGNWERYQTWEIPTVGSNSAQDVRIQFVYRPVETGELPDPTANPYPYITIEVFTQDASFTRDGWGCTSAGGDAEQTWWAPGESWDDTPYPTWLVEVEATFGCGGGAPLDRDLDYEVTLRTAEETFIPLFTAGYLRGMESDLDFNADDSSYSMTISGAPRPWQWLGGDWRQIPDGVDSDDPDSYANYFDATNWDWSYSTYDGRTISFNSPSIEPCIGDGMAATSTNGNGGYVPTWNYSTQSLQYNTDGRHFMPSNIDDSGDPTAATSAGLVYAGEAEIVVPTPLALCMWGDAGFTSVSDLQNLAGQVRTEAGGLKGGAAVEIAVDDTAMYVKATGYSYSTAALVVAPTVGATPLASDVGTVTVGDVAFAEFEVRNNDDSDPYTFATAPALTSGSVGEFSIASTQEQCFDDSVTLQPGEVCRIAVMFEPTQTGAVVATVSFTTSPALGGAHQVTVGGTGLALPPGPPAPAVAGAPQSVVAVAGDGSATLTWSPPVSSGSFPVTSYRATSRPGGATCLVSVTECRVGGLTNGTTYTFVVEALTGAGWGTASAASNSVTPAAGPDPVEPAITITGSRDGRFIRVEGSSTGLDLGAVLKPWFRFAGQSGYSEGAASILVAEDGTFEWGRRAGKRMSVYVQAPDGSARSNAVTIQAR